MSNPQQSAFLNVLNREPTPWLDRQAVEAVEPPSHEWAERLATKEKHLETSPEVCTFSQVVADRALREICRAGYYQLGEAYYELTKSGVPSPKPAVGDPLKVRYAWLDHVDAYNAHVRDACDLGMREFGVEFALEWIAANPFLPPTDE